VCPAVGVFAVCLRRTGADARADAPDTDGDDICRATLRLVGPYLLVDDNNDCGGANVTFDGVYRKKKR